MNRTTPSSRPATQADGRDGRVVGKDDDGALESMGKAIVAPIEGADEDAAQERPFEDLTRTLPQGRDAADEPTLRRAKRPH